MVHVKLSNLCIGSCKFFLLLIPTNAFGFADYLVIFLGSIGVGRHQTFKSVLIKTINMQSQLPLSNLSTHIVTIFFWSVVTIIICVCMPSQYYSFMKYEQPNYLRMKSCHNMNMNAWSQYHKYSSRIFTSLKNTFNEYSCINIH